MKRGRVGVLGWIEDSRGILYTMITRVLIGSNIKINVTCVCTFPNNLLMKYVEKTTLKYLFFKEGNISKLLINNSCILYGPRHNLYWNSVSIFYLFVL